MESYTRRISTWVLGHALFPFHRQPPDVLEAAGNGPTPMELSASDYAEAHRLFCDLFSPWWTKLPPGFERHVAILREDVHKRCRLRNSSCLGELRQFYRELTPLVSNLASHEESLRLEGSEQQEENHDSMDLDPRPQALTRAQEEMDVDSDSDVVRERDNGNGSWGSDTLILPHKSSGASETVPRRRVEGDCTICFSPLENDQISAWLDDFERKLSDFTLSSKPGESLFEDEDGDDDDYDDFYDGELVWCSASCGINYHLDCFERWMDEFNIDEEVTCPSCRRYWNE